MAQAISSEIIDDLHRTSRELIEQNVVGHSPADAPRLGAESFLGVIAWNVLLPCVTSVAAGLSVEALKRKLFAKDFAGVDAEKRVKESLGKELKPLTSEQREVCVAAIHHALEPLGATVEQSRALADKLIDRLNSYTAKS